MATAAPVQRGRPPKPKPQQNLWRQKYGLEFEPVLDMNGVPRHQKPDVLIELYILRNYDGIVKKIKSHQLMAWREHFKRFVSLIWDHPGSNRRFQWNPNAERMLDAAIEHKFLGIAGHASSSKSEFGAIWGLCKFLIGAPGPNGEAPNPMYVKVFVTSTTLQDSRGRIWGVIEAYWNEACKAFGGEQNMPGKLVSSKGVIRGKVDDKFSDLSGIALIAGGKGEDKDAPTKIGFKARCVILIADELALLTHQLFSAAQHNLFSNPSFQMLGIANPTSIFDPFGIFITPKHGWNSINDESDSWETQLGFCVRFDGLKSPNVLAGREIYPGLLTLEKLNGFITAYGANSPGFWAMVRGYFCPSGNTASIFSEMELATSLCMEHASNWDAPATKLAFLDPSFTLGGDRAVASFGKCGMVVDRKTGAYKRVLDKDESIDLMTRVDAKSELDISSQVARLYVEECKKRNIPPTHAGVDSTGGGTPFASILTSLWGAGVILVSFGGAPSDKRVSPVDKRTGKERFYNRVSELVYIVKELLKNGQIKGIDAQTASEMCNRLYENRGEKVLVESKKAMKIRTNNKQSPDFADSHAGLTEVARIKCGLSSELKAHKDAPRQGGTYGDPRLNAVMNPSWGQKKVLTLADDAAPTFAGGGWGE